MECCAIWFRVEDHEIRGYKMTLNFGSAIVEKNTEKQLARTNRKRRSAGNDWRGKIPVTNYKETKEIDRTHAKRRLTAIGTVIEGKLEGNKAKNPRQIMLDWMLVYSFRELKDETQHRTRGWAIDAYI